MQELKRITILFLIPTLTCGGAERVIVNLLKNLDQARFKLIIGIIDTTNSFYLKDIPIGVDVIDFRAKSVKSGLLKVAKLIWSITPNIVFSTVGHLNLALAIARPFLPSSVRFIARETSIVSNTLIEYKYPKLWVLLYSLFYKHFDLVVCQSRAMQIDLIRNFNFPEDKSVVLNNPVDVDLIRKESLLAINQYKINSSKINLVAAGRMCKVKGFDLLIEAIFLLNDRRVQLLLIGDGPQRLELECLAKKRGVAEQVEFLGFQSNPFPWFATADAFILPSRSEGFPNVVLEALSCGTPVIATPSVGGLIEIIENIPECSMATNLTSEALADAISDWIASPGKRVPESAVSPYGVKNITKKYEDLFVSMSS